MTAAKIMTVGQFVCVTRKTVKELLNGKGDNFGSGHVS